MTDDSDLDFKVIFIGDTAVGKVCLFNSSIEAHTLLKGCFSLIFEAF